MNQQTPDAPADFPSAGAPDLDDFTHAYDEAVHRLRATEDRLVEAEAVAAQQELRAEGLEAQVILLGAHLESLAETLERERSMHDAALKRLEFLETPRMVVGLQPPEQPHGRG